LRLLGMWPGPKKQAIEVKNIALAVFHGLFFCVLIGFEFPFAVKNMSTSPLLAIGCLGVISSRAICVAKIMNVVFMHKKLKQVLETIDEMQKGKSGSEIQFKVF
jgi:hypothetical protein